jgi:hypothetical protein
MTLAHRLSHHRRLLGFSSALVLALSLAGTSTVHAQSAYQAGWQGGRSAVTVDLSAIDGLSAAPTRAVAVARLRPPADVQEARGDEVIVDTSVLDSLGPVEPANARRIVLHRPTEHYAGVATPHYHFRQFAHVRHAHRHLAHRTAHGGIKLAAAKTKGADGQCCPVPDSH